jgi:hypothetical protein
MVASYCVAITFHKNKNKNVFPALTPSRLRTLINQMLDLTDISKSSIGSWQQVRFAYVC